MNQQRANIRNLLCGLSLAEVKAVRASHAENAENVRHCNEWIAECIRDGEWE